MTNANSLWLDAVLQAEGADRLARRIADASAKDETLKSLGSLSLFQGAVADAVKPCLHIDLLAFFAEGWRTAQEIRAARDGDGVTILKLGSHAVTREIRPAIAISGIRKPLDMSFVFTGSFEGIELSIANGALASVGSGTCDLTIEFDLAGRALQDPVTLTKWKLPGEYRFDPPLEIP